MWTVSQVAERDRVTKQAVSQKVRRLADTQNLIVERDANGRILKLNVAHYDLLRARYDDPARAQAPQTDTGTEPNDESYKEAKRVQAWFDVERLRMLLAEEKRRLVPLDEVKAGSAEALDIISQVISTLPDCAEELAAAIAKDGSHGARLFLAGEALRLRRDIAAACRRAAESDKGTT
jgi:hypothetical protein